MTRIEELLSRALLVRERTVPRDIVPPPPSTAPTTDPAQTSTPHSAAQDLRTLCETLLTHTPPTQIADFVTDQVPEPHSALVLACVLQLTDTDEGARFWWQYAAGAGQATAAYCLYLHHLALGEEDTADWWHRQTDDIQPSPENTTPDDQPDARWTCNWYPADHHPNSTSTTTILRTLRHLSKHTARSQSTAVTNLMAYIPDAVTAGYLTEPDTELPLPGPGFAHRITALLTTADPLRSRTTPTPRGPHGAELTSPHPDAANTAQRA